MAKKTAAKKKLAPVKAKPKATPKITKPLKKAEVKTSKPVKVAKVAAVDKKVKTSEKTISPSAQSSVKPALMTSKGKAPKEVKSANPKVSADTVEITTKKVQTVVTMIEDSAPQAEDAQKVEKISKIKPVKVERGNLNDEKAKWVELNKRYGKEKAYSYKMTEKYPSLVPLQHKVLGWGFVLTNDNDRLEVLFENGIRMLISNYKN